MAWLRACCYDLALRNAEARCLTAWRAALLRDARGVVLDVGAGTGLNLSHVPRDNTRLILTEPDPDMRARLARRAAAERPDAELLDAPAESLPLPDASVDVVVSTLVLCSVAEQAPALAELRRVLRPGGRLLFLEHVAAEEGSALLRWQRRLEPLWWHIAERCALTRRTDEALLSAGFTLESMTRAPMRGGVPWVSPTIRGVARPR
ncbi:methyltransferase domain-containing protein [Myxococcota bacterium]|nr:methyltransferase domain-containing protein [Myxococcota bacterium]